MCVSLVTQFAQFVVSFTLLQTFELYYDIKVLCLDYRQICPGLDSLLDNRNTCHRRSPVPIRVKACGRRR